MLNDFWKKPLLMLQQNLRLIDAKGVSSTELAKQLIDEIEHYGGSAILANAGGIVAWYPTALSFHRRWRICSLQGGVCRGTRSPTQQPGR